MTPDRTRIFEIVRACVADSLAMDPAGISLASSLATDLGATSLDFVDILFTLEEKFGIKIPDSEIDFLKRADHPSRRTTKEGFLPPESVAALDGWLPALRTVPDRGRVTPAMLYRLLTVETLCIIVERRLGSAGLVDPAPPSP